jgi:TonB family protein
MRQFLKANKALVLVLSLELHLALFLLASASGFFATHPASVPKPMEVVAVEPAEATPAPVKELPKPQVPKADPVPQPLAESLDRADPGYSGMTVPTSDLAGSHGAPKQQPAPPDPWSDFVTQASITKLPEIPTNELLTRIQYPPLAARQGIEATVYLELFINSSGTIIHITVLKDPGYGFAEAAVKALMNLSCSPGQVDGRPASVRFRFPVRFSLH